MGFLHTEKDMKIGHSLWKGVFKRERKSSERVTWE